MEGCYRLVCTEMDIKVTSGIRVTVASSSFMGVAGRLGYTTFNVLESERSNRMFVSEKKQYIPEVLIWLSSCIQNLIHCISFDFHCCYFVVICAWFESNHTNSCLAFVSINASCDVSGIMRHCTTRKTHAFYNTPLASDR